MPERLCGSDNWNGSVDASDTVPRAVRWAARENRFSDPVWSKWHYTEGNGAFTACGSPVVLFVIDGSPETNEHLQRVNCKRCLGKMRKHGLLPAVLRLFTKESKVTHNEAKQILDESDAEVVLDEESGLARLNGQFTIEQLHAVLQLLEYGA